MKTIEGINCNKCGTAFTIIATDAKYKRIFCPMCKKFITDLEELERPVLRVKVSNDKT